MPAFEQCGDAVTLTDSGSWRGYVIEQPQLRSLRRKRLARLRGTLGGIREEVKLPPAGSAAGRFAETHFERPDGEGTRLVCQSFAHWNSQKGRAVRILVRYGA